MIQEIAWQLGGKVKQCEHREYGFAKVQIAKLGNGGSADALFDGLGDELEASFTYDPYKPTLTGK